jgi:hypothetical protein
MMLEMTKGFYTRLWLAGKIKVYAKNIALHCYKTKTAIRCDSYPTPRRILPPPVWVCVNVDAALFPNGNRMGWGVVIRDHAGVVKLSASIVIDGITSPVYHLAMLSS